MKITEANMSIFNAPQGYYVAGAISRDLNFSVGLPAQFDKTYSAKKRLNLVYGEEYDIRTGVAYCLGNLFLLTVKDSSYDSPNRNELFKALECMRDCMETEGVDKLAIPKLCCGKRGLEWSEVKSMIESVFSDYDIDILVCCQ